MRLDTFMGKTARLYQDTRNINASNSPLDKLNDELHDVTRIMTKNMEELLWRGDSLDSTHAPPITSSWTFVHVLLARDVAPVDVATVRVGEVPTGSTEYQHPSDDSGVRACGRRAAHHPHLPLLAILMRRSVSGLDWMYSVFTTLNFLIPRRLQWLPSLCPVRCQCMRRSPQNAYVRVL